MKSLRTTIGSISLATAMAMTAVSPAAATAVDAVADPGVVLPEVDPWLAGELTGLGADDLLEVIVHGVDFSTVEAAVSAQGLLDTHAAYREFEAFDAAVALGTASQILALQDVEGLTYLEGNKPYQYLTQTSHHATNAVAAEAAAAASELSYELMGAGVGIAVVDSGIEPTAPSFNDVNQTPADPTDDVNKIVRRLKVGCPLNPIIDNDDDKAEPDTFVNDMCVFDAPSGSDTASSGGHGTHVAGIAAGYEVYDPIGDRLLRGAAPHAELTEISTGAVILVVGSAIAMNWVYENHANPCDGRPVDYPQVTPNCSPIRVTNHSYGPLDQDGNPEPEFLYNKNAIEQKLNRALVRVGVTPVWASGNDGSGPNEKWSSPSTGEKAGGVLVVANYDDANDGRRDGALSSSSSTGKTGLLDTHPDLAAPGTGITSACAPTLPICKGIGVVENPNFGTISGTSMAAPHVAGIAAVITSAAHELFVQGVTLNPNYEMTAEGWLTPAAIEDLLEDTATERGSAPEVVPATDTGVDFHNPVDHKGSRNKTDYAWGHGLVDVDEAMRALTNASGGGGGGGGGGTPCVPLIADPLGDAAVFGAVPAADLDIASGDISRVGDTIVLEVGIPALREVTSEGTNGDRVTFGFTVGGKAYEAASERLVTEVTDTEPTGILSTSYYLRDVAAGEVVTFDLVGEHVPDQGVRFELSLSDQNNYLGGPITDLTPISGLNLETRGFAGLLLFVIDSAASECTFPVPVSNGPTVTIADVTVDEGDGTATLTLTLDEDADSTSVTVSTGATGDTATATDDYTPLVDEVVAFADGEQTATVSVTIVDDEVEEDAEAFTVTITSATGVTIGTADNAAVTITDNDAVAADADVQIQTINGVSTSATIYVDVDQTFGVDGSAIVPAADNVPNGTVEVAIVPAGEPATGWATAGDTSAAADWTTWTIDVAAIAVGDWDIHARVVNDADGAVLATDGPYTVTAIVPHDPFCAPRNTRLGEDIAGDAIPFLFPGDPAISTPSLDLRSLDLETMADGTLKWTLKVEDLGEDYDLAGERFVVEFTAGTSSFELVAARNLRDDTGGLGGIFVVNEAFTITRVADDVDDTITGAFDADADTITWFLPAGIFDGAHAADLGLGQQIVFSLASGNRDNVTGYHPLDEMVPNGCRWYVGQDLPLVATIGDASVNEGEVAAVTISLDRPAFFGESVLLSTVDLGSAEDGSDYAGFADVEIVFESGQSQATVGILALDDGVHEATEHFGVSIAAGTDTVIGAPSDGVVTIVDNDDPPVLTATAATVAEAPGAQLVVELTLDAPALGNVDVQFATNTLGDTNEATADVDYTSTSGTVVIADGATSGSVTIDVLDDAEFEGNEIVNLSLYIATPNATFAGGADSDLVVNTITDEADRPLPTITIAGGTVDEPEVGSTAPLVFTVEVAGDVTEPIVVDLALAGGTAGASDHNGLSTTQLTFTAAGTQTVTVEVVGDNEVEPSETVDVRASTTHAVFASSDTATGTIVDRPLPVDPAASIADVTITEGTGGTSTATFVVTLDRPADADVALRATTVAGTATADSDYLSQTDALVFIAAGDQSAQFHVQVIADNLAELDETFTVTLAAESGATINDGEATGTIIDDDVPTASVQNFQVREDAAGAMGPIMVEVRLDQPAVKPAKVWVSTEDGGKKAAATAPDDYETVGQWVYFEAGQQVATFALTIHDDDLVEERKETFRILLSQADGVTLGQAVALVTIRDDDRSRHTGDCHDGHVDGDEHPQDGGHHGNGHMKDNPGHENDDPCPTA